MGTTTIIDEWVDPPITGMEVGMWSEAGAPFSVAFATASGGNQQDVIYTSVNPASFPSGTRLNLSVLHRRDTNPSDNSGWFIFVYDGSNWTRLCWRISAGGSTIKWQIQQVASRNTAMTATPDDDANSFSYDVNTQYVFMLQVDSGDNISGKWVRDPLVGSWSETRDGDYADMGLGVNLSVGAIQEIGIGVAYTAGSTTTGRFDTLQMLSNFSNDPVGLDASIKFNSYYLRTALNGGGNATLIAPAPFYDAVSAATFRAQLKKLLTYTNSFGAIQWEGETSTLDLSIHGAVFEAEEVLKKTQFVEVGGSPVIFSTFLRQWNDLVITDKDGGFVRRGVTTSHIVAFQKADTKVYEGRATRNEFTIVEAGDLSTPLVPSEVSNGKDEEMYYYDTWDTDDTDKAHIVLNSPGDLAPFVVKYPVDLYEKFINLTKLNKLEIKTTISAVRTFDDAWTSVGGDSGRYFWYLFNYQSNAWEIIKKIGQTALSGDATTSTVSGTNKYYNPQYITVNVADELKSDASDWLTATAYVSGDRVINEDILFTCILNHTSGDTDDEPGVGSTTATYWQRTVYDFINYETTAGSAAIFSKLNCIVAIRTTVSTTIGVNGFWMWDFSVRATFDDDNEPEFSSASISAVAADGMSITLNATSGINLPEKDGFGVGDIMAIVKSAEDYLQDTWDASPIASDIGALNINITTGSSVGVTDDHTTKSFFTLMQHIGELTNSTFFPDYGATRTVEMVSADNHVSSGLTITKDDILDYNAGNWSISYDATKQRNALRVLGDNVNFIKTLTPDNDPFDMGDETEIINDSNIQTLLQASDYADSITPRRESSEVIVQITIDFTNPIQDYSTMEIGKSVILKLPTATDTSIFTDTLIIMAIELNRNEQTGDKEYTTYTLQKRHT